MAGQPWTTGPAWGRWTAPACSTSRTSVVLDRLTRLAARVVGAPVSLVSLVDAGAQHFAAEVGLPRRGRNGVGPRCRTRSAGWWSPRGNGSWSATRRRTRECATTGDPDLGVGLAGFPLVDDDGNVLGSFCVIGETPREWIPDEELESIADIAAAAASAIRSRAALRTSAARVSLLAEATRALHAALDVRSAAQALADQLVPALADLCVVDRADADGRARVRTSIVVARDPRVRQVFMDAERGGRASTPPPPASIASCAAPPPSSYRVDADVLGRIARTTAHEDDVALLALRVEQREG